MADKKISALTEATTITSTDVLPGWLLTVMKLKRLKTETISQIVKLDGQGIKNVYDSNNKLALSSETQVTLPNNAGTTKYADFDSAYDNCRLLNFLEII